MLANATFELKMPVTWWDDLVHSMSFLSFHCCFCLRDHFLHDSLRGIFAYCWSIIFPRKKKTNSVLFQWKLKNCRKSVKIVSKSSCNFHYLPLVTSKALLLYAATWVFPLDNFDKPHIPTVETIWSGSKETVFPTFCIKKHQPTQAIKSKTLLSLRLNAPNFSHQCKIHI